MDKNYAVYKFIVYEFISVILGQVHCMKQKKKKMNYNFSLIKFVTLTNCKDDTVVNLYEENQNETFPC